MGLMSVTGGSGAVCHVLYLALTAVCPPSPGTQMAYPQDTCLPYRLPFPYAERQRYSRVYGRYSNNRALQAKAELKVSFDYMPNLCGRTRESVGKGHAETAPYLAFLDSCPSHYFNSQGLFLLSIAETRPSTG